jgi:hypothetical protein
VIAKAVSARLVTSIILLLQEPAKPAVLVEDRPRIRGLHEQHEAGTVDVPEDDRISPYGCP